MKKVRFLSPVKKQRINGMNDSECHSPRPFIEKQVKTVPPITLPDYLPYRRVVPFTNDPVQRYDYGNTSPYPIVNKTCLQNSSNLENKWSPSNELDLSILDGTYHDSRKMLPKPRNTTHSQEMNAVPKPLERISNAVNSSPRILSSIENCSSSPPNVLNKNDDFFLRRDNLKDLKHVHSQLHNLHLDKENNPLLKKSEIMKLGIPNSQIMHSVNKQVTNCPVEINQDCRCHHCVHVFNTKHSGKQTPINMITKQCIPQNNYKICHCVPTPPKSCSHCPCKLPPMSHFMQVCNCTKLSQLPTPQNAVDKKNWTLEKYEQNKDCLDVETQQNIFKEKREPTVADLFKIIKLQNEQLQLLQEKVDKFISASNSHEAQRAQPIQNYVSEHVEVKSIETDEKISIGVMTSFEMFRTSTIINKEVVKQSEAQIQCNRSQISIKEVVSKAPVNFLEGIAPVASQQINNNLGLGDVTKNTDNVDKTLNEMSLYNVQVDNATTPMMSPEQSLYLDVRDYSDSDASSDDQSNVGWTYYNKVMTHVNGMLQESDMPSSASAMYRNGKQKYLQMQADKTNISVAKRVTFGDDKLGIPNTPHLQDHTTDTSLKMNQLAAKYLKDGMLTSKTPSPKPLDMSLATRNYMENHKLLQGNLQLNQQHIEIPKFLDITALKRQPKLL